MARIRLIRIHCVNKNDVNKEDEININLDGKKFAGTYNIRQDQKVLLNSKDYEFTGTVDVQLVEVDGQVGGNNDDRLGTRHIKDNLEVRDGLVSYEAPGTYYTLEYSVFLD